MSCGSFSIAGPLLLAFLGAGCIHFKGSARNPAFREATAPPPSLVSAPLVCRAGRSGHGDQLVAQIRLLVRAQTGTEGVSLSGTEQSALCANLENDRDGILGDPKDWSVGAILSSTIRAIAEANQVGSVVLPVVATQESCEADKSTVRNAQGQTVATVDHGTTTCEESPGGLLHLYLFSADGTLLWKSWAIVRSTDGRSIEGSVTGLFLGIPVDLAAARERPTDAAARSHASTTESSASAEEAAVQPVSGADAAPAARDAEIEPILRRTLAKAPPACMTYVRLQCQAMEGAPEWSTMCTAFANSVQKMAATTPAIATWCAKQAEALQPAAPPPPRTPKAAKK
jgi:hypothetical protein